MAKHEAKLAKLSGSGRSLLYAVLVGVAAQQARKPGWSGGDPRKARYAKRYRNTLKTKLGLRPPLPVDSKGHFIPQNRDKQLELAIAKVRQEAGLVTPIEPAAIPSQTDMSGI